MQVGPQLHTKDISLHFNPRFDPKNPVVVRNSLRSDVWGTHCSVLKNIYIVKELIVYFML